MSVNIFIDLFYHPTGAALGRYRKQGGRLLGMSFIHLNDEAEKLT
jgi:hypothetical protein